MSSGDILAWQNVDDLYMPDTIKTAADFFINNPDVDIIYGDYQLINFDGSWRCTVYPIPWNKWLFAHGRFVPLQPTLFWRRRVYEHVGELDLNLHYCMDVDFLARASKKFSFVKIPKVLGKFRIHNKSKTQNPENKKNVECEYFEVLSHHFKYNLLDRLIFIYFKREKNMHHLLNDVIYEKSNRFQ